MAHTFDCNGHDILLHLRNNSFEEDLADVDIRVANLFHRSDKTFTHSLARVPLPVSDVSSHSDDLSVVNQGHS